MTCGSEFLCAVRFAAGRSSFAPDRSAIARQPRSSEFGGASRGDRVPETPAAVLGISACARALFLALTRGMWTAFPAVPPNGGTSGSCALPAASCGRACYLWPSGHWRRPQCGVACRTCGRRLVWPALVAARKGEKGARRPAPSPDSAPRLSAISMRRAGRGLEIPRADVCSEDLHRARACDVLTIEVRSAATGAPTLGPIQADGRRVRGLQAIAQRVVHLSFPISAASGASGPSSGS